MANYGYMAKIGADTSGLQAGLKDINSALKTTDNELYKVNKSIKNAQQAGTDRAELLKQKEDVLKNAISETAQKLERLKSVEENVRNAADSGNISAENYRDYQREIANTEAQLRQYQTQLAQTQQAEQNSAGANQVVVTSLQDVQSAYQKVISDIKFFTDAIGAAAKKAADFSETAVKYSLNVGQSFESSMSQVKAYSGAVGDDFEKLESAAKDAGATTSKSATEAADALGYMALAGWNTEEMLDGLMPIVRASEAGTADLKRTSDLVTDSMSAMGVATDDLSHYLDVCTAAQSNSNTTLTALLEAYVGCGGTLRNLNVPLEESATLLGTLANRGIKASEAGTSLNSILVNLMGANKSARDAMESLGVSAWDAQGNFIGVTETLRQLDAALENCTEEQKNFLEAKIGGKTQMDTLQALIAGVRDEYGELYTTLENSQGALEQTADTMHDNLAGALTTMKSALEALGVEFYDYLEEPAREAVEAVTEAIRTLTESVDKGQLGDHLKNLSEKFGELIEKLAEFAAEKGIPMLIDGLSDLVDVLSWAADNFDLVTGAVKTVGAAFLALKFAKTIADIEILVTSIIFLKNAAEAGSAAAKILGITLDAIPFVAIAAGVAALAVATTETVKACLDAKVELAELRNEMDKAGTSLTDTVTAINKMRESVEQVSAETETSIAVADRALDTLDDLVDENGNLKDAQYNVDEQLKILNDTFGLHLTVIDGQIQGYKDLKTSYEEYVDSLRRNAKLEAMRPTYVRSVERLENIDDETRRLEQEKSDIEEDIKSVKEGHSNQLGRKEDYAKSDEYKIWKAETDKERGLFNKADILKNDDDLLEFLEWRSQQAKQRIEESIAEKQQIEKNIKEYEDLATYSPNSSYVPPENSGYDDNEPAGIGTKWEEKRQQKKDAVLDQLKELEDKHKTDQLEDEAYYAQLQTICDENKALFQNDPDSDFWKFYNKWESYQKSRKKKKKKTSSEKAPNQEAERAASAAASKKKKELNVKKQKDDNYTDADYYNDLEKFAEEELDRDTEVYADIMDEIEIGRKQIRDKASEEEKKAAEKSVTEKIAQKRKELQKQVDEGKHDELWLYGKLGKYLANGSNWSELEKASEAFAKANSDINENAEKSAIKQYISDFDELANKYEQGIISEEEYRRELLEIQEKYAGYEIDISERIAEREKEIAEKRAEEAKKAAEKQYDDVREKYADLEKEISSRADELTKGALGSGSIFEEKEISGGEKKKVFTDLSAKKKEIEKYTADLKKLRETNIPADLMDEIMSMNYDDRRDVISELLKMSADKRELYYSDYTAYHAAAKEAAELEYSDEKAKIYQEFGDAYAGTVDLAGEYGRDAARAYIDAYSEEMRRQGLPVFAKNFTQAPGNYHGYPESPAAAEINPGISRGNYISVNTPIQINVAGTSVIRTTLNDILVEKGMSGRNSNLF